MISTLGDKLKYIISIDLRDIVEEAFLPKKHMNSRMKFGDTLSTTAL